ncbi:MAG: hypothetical protein CMJ84_03115 [Planctomycetes bacterium]|jgi:arylsulfatase A-like enzyme|nr:hypothetical protein [Planctomycetota bacterium]MDP6410719.1 sulfatase-like hydrolase/transferase [Planctomycetota bacterium]
MTAAPPAANQPQTPRWGVRRVAPVAAAATAALGCTGLHWVSLAASRVSFDPPYLALCAGLSLAASAALGGLAARARLSSAACLALWAGLAGGLHGGLLAAAAMTLAGAAGVWVGRAGGDRPYSDGLLVGGGFALAVGVAPALAARLGASESARPFLAALAFLGLWGAGRWLAARPARRLSQVSLFVATAGILVAMSVRPLWDHERAARRGAPPVSPREARAESGRGPDIVLLVLDTVRADHLSIYGYERETTPVLAALLARRGGGRAHPLALSNGTWTVPSHASLLTGLSPSEHGARLGNSSGTAFALRADLTLAEALRGVGYRTLSIYANTWLGRIAGMERGFDHYRQSGQFGSAPPIGERLRGLLLPSVAAAGARPKASAADVSAKLLAALDAARGGPAFLFANFVDAHAPYLPPREFRGRFAPWSPFERPEHLALAQSEAEKRRLEARYDECIAGLDRDLGLFFDELDRRGRLAGAWIIVTSDHGEAFGEHGVTEHGTTVYGEVTHVPLLLIPPEGVELGELVGAASLVDVAATVAAVAGAEWPGGGRDLRRGAGAGVPPTLVEFDGDPHKARRHGELARLPARALVEGTLKLVSHGGASELYDLAVDPGERRDLAADHPDDVRRLESLLGEWDAGVREDAGWTGALPPSELEALRKMGYLGGDD